MVVIASTSSIEYWQIFNFQRLEWSGNSIGIESYYFSAVYPESELKTLRFMEENSYVCELTSFDIYKRSLI